MKTVKTKTARQARKTFKISTDFGIIKLFFDVNCKKFR